MQKRDHAPGRRYHRATLAVAALSLLALLIILPGPESAAAQDPPASGSAGAEQAAEPEPEDASDQRPEDEEAEGKPLASRPLRVADAAAAPNKTFLGGRRDASFRFTLRGSESREILVKVVHVGTGEIQRRFRLGAVEPGERQRLSWDGKRGKRGFTEQGKHAFRVFSEGERAAVSKDSASQRFGFYGHRFPVLGRHTYGDGFGAGRNHQGQDVFAACGTRIVAARGGRIQTRAYHSAAGYYVVIDGRGTGQDYVYMHLQRRDRPKEGSWVKTGQLLGYNGDTGNASGCHLHFEMWTRPGWYEGGRAKPVTKQLKRWDRWS